MDLKSLKEKKIMLSESNEMESNLLKPPFKLNIEGLHQKTQLQLDSLCAVCKIVKPHSAHSCTLACVSGAVVDLDHRNFIKLQQLHILEEDITALKSKSNLMPSILQECTELEEELNRRIQEDDLLPGNIVPEVFSSIKEPEDQTAASRSKGVELLLEDYNLARNLYVDNAGFKQRLKSIPVKPGFNFCKDNLQKLLEERLLHLQDLKRQVFEDSMDE